MSRYKAYPEYVDTGNESLGLIPSEWAVCRLKQIVDQQRQITYGIVQAGPNINGGIPYIRPADMQDEGGVKDLDGLLRTSPSIASAYERSKIKTGDLVCSIGPSFGKVMLVPESLNGANLTQGTARIAVKTNNHTRFVFWLLRSSSSYQQWESSVGGATFRALNLSPLAETVIPLPSFATQLNIAAFLDHETAKTDALIEKQQLLIELLKEKRQAAISHAVTKGLNPNTPMKDSGVEWFGKVPTHWDIWKLSHAFSEIGSGTTPRSDNFSFYENGEIPWLNTGDLNDGELYECDKRITQLALREHSTLKRYPENSLAIAMYGATIAKVAILRFATTVNQACCVFGDSRIVSTKFLFYWILGFRAQIISLGTGGGQPNISQEILRNLRLACPTLAEQSDITNYLDIQASKFDELIKNAEQFIQLLEERRTALISAAVTGKIDVRDWQAAA